MSKTQIIEEQRKQIVELQSRVEDVEAAFRQTHASVDAVLYEIVKKYGDEELKIVISVPDTSAEHKVTAEKEDDTYVIRVASEQ